MKLLLTSGGITNASIHNSLVNLLGKPVEECSALLIPTAIYAHPMAGPFVAWQAISGQFKGSLSGLGWKSLGVLELTALPSLPQELWLPLLHKIDALLVEGGDALYLAYWMQHSGVAKLLPSLDAIYVGLSAGSMVMTPRVGEYFVQWIPPSDGDAPSISAMGTDVEGKDQTLGMVDFAIFPHLDHPDMLPHNSMADAEKWAAKIGVPGYAIDDESAIQVVDGNVEVISEGHWKLLTP
jgi:dipeptidase E